MSAFGHRQGVLALAGGQPASRFANRNRFVPYGQSALCAAMAMCGSMSSAHRHHLDGRSPFALKHPGFMPCAHLEDYYLSTMNSGLVEMLL